MLITIGEHDPATRAVDVTFMGGDIVHRRAVNACYDKAGTYDPAATAERVDEVGRGVAVKIGLGVLAAPTDDATDVDG